MVIYLTIQPGFRGRIRRYVDRCYIYCSLLTAVPQGCVLNVLRHLPRSLFSDAQVETILWACTALGVDQLPSIRTLKTIDKKLQSLCGIDTIRHEGRMGHLFYINSLSQIIAQVRISCSIG